MVEGEGFEPSKAEPADLQSDPFGHSGTPPLFGNPVISISGSYRLESVSSRKRGLLCRRSFLIASTFFKKYKFFLLNL